MSAPATHIHDLVGIGIGPFGLGLAALSDPLPDVDAVFLDQRE
ncbi:MAG: lysine N(6)-hydroxylase/L-ornithine N(5)-oxygenase family protein, partial [Brevibacterium sp.]|nr:lysine N(6)-hydroxylase/L-ornithine N(5)-oxygenase family protein [Brevibacterium sp.]